MTLRKWISITSKYYYIIELKNCYLLQCMICRLQSKFQYLKVEIHREGQLYWYLKSLNSFLSTGTYFAEKEAFDYFKFAIFKAPQDQSSKPGQVFYRILPPPDSVSPTPLRPPSSRAPSFTPMLHSPACCSLQTAHYTAVQPFHPGPLEPFFFFIWHH